MGRNQRIRKEEKLEKKKTRKEIIEARAKEKFWRVANPLIKTFSALLFTVLIMSITFFVFGKLDDNYGKPKVQVSKEAEIKTDKGIIRIAFYDKDAPKTVQNFQLLTKRGYYNGTKFHRVEPGFVIQGGDPLSKDEFPDNDGTGGESAWGGKFADELNKDTGSYKTGYKTGVVAMANSGTDTNGSQFFILLGDQKDMPNKYTIFGHVTSGMDVVKNIKKGDVMKEVKMVEVPVTSSVK